MVDYGDTSKEKKGTFTVLDTLPCAITWFYNGTNHRIEHQDKLIPLILKIINMLQLSKHHTVKYTTWLILLTEMVK